MQHVNRYPIRVVQPSQKSLNLPEPAYKHALTVVTVYAIRKLTAITIKNTMTMFLLWVIRVCTSTLLLKSWVSI